MTDATKTDETPKEERKPLSPEAREQLKRELKAQVRAFADALKAQIREKKAKEAAGGKAELDLDEAMRRADAEAQKKMAESLKRDTLDVASSGDGTSSGEDAGGAKPAEVAAAPEEGDAGAGKKEKAHVSALPKEELDRLTQDIIAALKTIYDPEIPVDIYELGLIYRIDISDDRVITIDMTLTAPGCPVAGDMPGWVQKAVGEVEGVKEVRVNLVFDPPWDMSRMSDEARLALNMW